MMGRDLAAEMLSILGQFNVTLSERDEARALAAAVYATNDAPMVILLRALAVAVSRAVYQRRDAAQCPVVQAIVGAIREASRDH